MSEEKKIPNSSDSKKIDIERLEKGERSNNVNKSIPDLNESRIPDFKFTPDPPPPPPTPNSSSEE